jgi:hypothetical protein
LNPSNASVTPFVFECNPFGYSSSIFQAKNRQNDTARQTRAPSQSKKRYEPQRPIEDISTTVRPRTRIMSEKRLRMKSKN